MMRKLSDEPIYAVLDNKIILKVDLADYGFNLPQRIYKILLFDGEFPIAEFVDTIDNDLFVTVYLKTI